MHALCDAIMDNHDALAEILTTEMGKPLAEAKGEIALGVKYVRFFAEQAKRIDGLHYPFALEGQEDPRHQGACRRNGRDYALELPHTR